MHDPIETERQYQTLLHSLSFPSASRQRLKEVCDFFKRLDASAASQEPYLLELGQRIIGLAAHETFDGWSPGDLRFLLQTLNHIQKVSPEIIAHHEFARTMDGVRLATARSFAYVGDTQTALNMLGFIISPEATETSELQGGDDVAPPLRLKRALDRARRQSDPIEAGIMSIINAWGPKATKNLYAATVPVIEKPITQQNEVNWSGVLRGVSLTILGELRDGKDEIHVSVSVVGAEDNTRHFFDPAIEAAHRLIAEKHSNLANKFVTCQIVFDGEHAMHEGSSANLAIAALFYCVLLHHTNQRFQYSLLPTVATTGAIDEQGNVLPVDPSTLAKKVEAAFFSWIEYLVVPKQQLQDAILACEPLARDHPRRTLPIIGIVHLREIFFDRRLTDLTRVPLTKHAIRKMQRWSKPIALTLILLLSITIAKIWYGPIDKNPVNYKFEGETLYLLNKLNDVVDNIRVGSPTVEASQIKYDRDPVPRFVALIDVDNDGRNEIVWIEGPMTKEGTLCIIKCKSVGEDTIRWSFPLIQTLQLPHNTDVTSNEFGSNQIIADDFENNGKPEVFVKANLNPFFPSMILKIDAKSGRELGHYVHIGHSEDMVAIDLDGDGIKEILVSGINNAFRNAFIAVLDPRYVAGHSPLTGNYTVDGYPPGTERAYIRIPKTIVGEAFRKQCKYNVADKISVIPSNKTFSVDIWDIQFITTNIIESITARLYCYFSFDLTVKDFGTGDDYDVIYEDLVKDGRIPPVRRDEYMRQYKKTILYWDGEGWQDHPVPNKWYVEALQQKR